MKILFLGTPDYSAKHLDALLKEGFEVVGVITQPDKPRGRGLKPNPSAVKTLAMERGLPIFEKLGEFPFDELNPDVGIVVAYGALIKKQYLDALPLGFYNVHPSLLPKYRGAAPIQRALENGEKVTGVTIFKLTEKLDAGPIAQQQSVEIEPFENFGQLEQKLIKIGCNLLIEVLKNIDNIKLLPQDDALATYAPKITTQDLFIDFFGDVLKVKDKIRAYDPQPGARAILNGEVVKLFGVVKIEQDVMDDPGKILKIDEIGAYVSTRNGVVVISDVQFPSKKRMKFSSALNGRLLKVGDRLQYTINLGGRGTDGRG